MYTSAACALAASRTSSVDRTKTATRASLTCLAPWAGRRDWRKRRAGEPIHTSPAGMSWVTIGPAPVTADSPTSNWRHQHRVAADRRVVANARSSLQSGLGIEVGGDRARRDVHACSDVGVADVAEVVHLRPGPDAAGLDLRIVAEPSVGLDDRAGPQVAERADLDAFADNRAFEHRQPHAAVRADFGIHEHARSGRSRHRARRASDRAGGSPGGRSTSASISTSGSMYVVAGSTMVTPARISVVQRAPAQDRVRLGELQAIVDAQHLVLVLRQHRMDAAALRGGQIDQLGQVVLAFRTDRQAVQRLPQPGRPDHDRAAPDLVDRALRRAWRRAPRPCAPRCRRRRAARAHSRAGCGRGRSAGRSAR